MALQTINLGTFANDGTGDDLRTAFQKVVNNFNHLRDLVEDAIIVENMGTGQGLFKQKDVNVLEFYNIKNGSNIIVTLDSDNNDVVVALRINSAVEFNDNAINNVGDIYNAGDIFLKTNKKLHGNVEGDLYGTVYPQVDDLIGYGHIVGPNSSTPSRVDGIPVLDVTRPIVNFDFGLVDPSQMPFKNTVQYLLFIIGMDFGTVVNPSNISVDGGPIIIPQPQQF